MANFRWYASRLRSMSAAEVGWRVGRVAARRAHASGLPLGRSATGYSDGTRDTALEAFRAADRRPVLLDRSRARAMADAHPRWAADLVDAAERAARLEVTYFGYPTVLVPAPVDWHFDPVSKTTWPTTASSAIDYRTAAGDVKWIWELNRLQHLPLLAQAWLITGEARFSAAAFDQLDDWIRQNPPGVGIGWRNPFEPGVRAISIALALQGLRDSPDLTTDRFGRITDMLVATAQCCWSDRSRFSSANNHLVGELAGLAVVALLFPDLPAATTWERRAVRELEVQADLQILDDGAGAEQAVGYQVFTAELLLVVGALLRDRDDQMPDGIRRALIRGGHYLAALVGDGDPAPRIGDDDEGFAFRLDGSPLRSVRDHLGLVAAVTGDPVSSHDGTASWTSAWFGGLAGSGMPTDATSSLETVGDSHHAPTGGLVILRSDRRRVVMDVGPLGFLAIAAHGHADALSVTVALDGEDLIGDPGAASYYGHPEWRGIHRGTRVHPTVEVDDVDQSVMAGPFMWSRHAEVRVNAVDLAAGIVDAEHDGYLRLPDPVRHRRWLLAPPDEDWVLVVDHVKGRGRHHVRTSWPLAPELDVARARDGHLVTRGGTAVAQIATVATSTLTIDEVRGDESSGLGFWSDRLESREPAWLVGATCSAGLPLWVATVIAPTSNGPGVSMLPLRVDGGRLVVAWDVGDQRRVVGVDPSGAGVMEKR
ncbi:alginate lyase family protein [Mycolicibacterium sp. GCM10028919]|uniref:heparinase II/III family protein n=1 Tax=Mycolicibacterium sp. GCM10028919 TaxID=3273401 RepID=UPI003614B1BA